MEIAVVLLVLAFALVGWLLKRAGERMTDALDDSAPDGRFHFPDDHDEAA